MRPGNHRDQTPEPKLVKLRAFSGPRGRFDAELAKNILEAQGIRCLLPGQIAGEMLPGVDLLELLVCEEDAEQAAEILKGYLDSPGAVPT
jgi:hypothetical protein